MENLIVTLIIVVIVAAAAGKIIVERRKGAKCIGCPHGQACSSTDCSSSDFS